MKWTELALCASLTTIAVGGLAYLAGEWAGRPAAAAAERGGEWWGRGWWRGGEDGRGHGWRCVCAEPAAFDHALGYLKRELGLTAAQTLEWERFAAALGEANARLRQACDGDPATARDAARLLAATEIQLAAATDWLKTARPALTRLYAALDERQRALIDTRFGPRHARR
jgi:hypothetical protein